MDRNEIIFLAILLAAYVVCAFTVKIPTIINYAFLAILLIAISAAILAKYVKTENNQISRISNILALVFLALYIISAIHEMLYQRALLVDSSIILIPFFGALVVGWFFKNS